MPQLDEKIIVNGKTYTWDGNRWIPNTSYSFNQIQINGEDKFNSFDYRNINFQGINLSIYSGGVNTLVFSAQPQTNSSSTFSGGTVSGATNFTGGLTANTIYATTYQNLPSSTFSGGTVTGPTNFTNGLTATTISATTYQNLPSSTFSGGTVTGPTNFTGGLSATTISQTTYIDFTTGSTNPSQTGGRVFFDNTSKALSYYDVVNSLVPIAMGQQLYTRVWNATGTQIDKGKVIAITGTSNNLPSAILARNVHSVGSDRPIGVAAENIPNGSEGLVLNNGILSGITLNTFSNGDTLYLSDTVPGGYVASTTSLSFTCFIIYDANFIIY